MVWQVSIMFLERVPGGCTFWWVKVLTVLVALILIISGADFSEIKKGLAKLKSKLADARAAMFSC